MNVHFTSFTGYAISFFKDQISPSLTEKNKKILLIASVIFGLLATLYVARCCFFKSEQLKAELLNDQEDKIFLKEELDEDLSDIDNKFLEEDATQSPLKRLFFPVEIVVELQNNFFSLDSLDDLLNAKVSFLPQMALTLSQESSIETFLKKSLSAWPTYKKNIALTLGLHQEEADELAKKIEDRMILLNNTFQIQDRMTLLASYPHIKKITLQDLEAPWNESLLKIALLLDEELAQLTFDQMMTLLPQQIEVLVKRLEQGDIEDVVSSSPIDISEDQFHLMTLAQIRQLNVAAVNHFIDQFDYNIIAILSDQQIANLDISKLSDAHIQTLFESRDKIKLLKSPQLEECIKRVNPLALQKLIGIQIQTLNLLDTYLITKVRFDAMLGKNFHPSSNIDWRRQNANMRHLKEDQIIEGFNRGLFDVATAKLLSDEQVKNLDFSKIDFKKAGGADLFSAIFETSSDKNRITLVKDKAKLLSLLPYVHPQILKDLDHSQIAMLDFNQLPWLQKIHFEFIVGKNFHPSSNIDWRRQNANMRHLKEDQIIEGFNRGLFDVATAKLLSDEQVKNLDFSKIDFKKAGGADLFSAIFETSSDKNRITLVKDKAKLLSLLPHVHPQILKDLDHSQIAMLDFNQLPWLQKIHFEFIVGKNFHPSSNIDWRRQNANMRHLTTTQVVNGLNRGFFDQETTKLLNDVQLKNLDLPKTTSINFKLIGSFDVAHVLQRLTTDSIKLLDFTNEDLITKPTFNLLVGKNFHPSSNIEWRRQNANMRHLEEDQIIEGFNRGLFDVATAKLLSDEQVKNLNFSKIDFKKAGGADLFSAIFETSSDKNRITLVKDKAKLLSLLPHVHPQILKDLDHSQIAMLDFNQLPWLQKIHFEFIVGKNFHPSSNIDWRRQNANMRHLTTTQVVNGLNRGFFDQETTKLLNDVQLKNLDLPKATSINFKLIGSFDVAHVLQRLTADSIKLLDFTNEDLITKPTFNLLVGKNFHPSSNIEWRRQNANMRHLKEDQIIEGFNRGLFDVATAKLLSDEQVKNLDFSKIDFKKAGGSDLFSAIFETSSDKNRITLVKDKAELLSLLPHVHPQILKDLDHSQIAMLDFNQLPWLQKVHFEFIVGKNFHPSCNIDWRRQNANMRYLKKDQIIEGVNRGLFDAEIAELLSDNQIYLLKLTDIPSSNTCYHIIKKRKDNL